MLTKMMWKCVLGYLLAFNVNLEIYLDHDLRGHLKVMTIFTNKTPHFYQGKRPTGTFDLRCVSNIFKTKHSQDRGHDPCYKT